MSCLLSLLSYIFIQEDVCGERHLPGYERVEHLSHILVTLLAEKVPVIEAEKRQEIFKLWNELDSLDKSPRKFKAAYTIQWGNSLYGRTKRDGPDASITQRIKHRHRSTPAQHINIKSNCLMFCIVKQIWLRISSNKSQIAKLYESLQQLLLNDIVLGKLGIPLASINNKSIHQFIQRQQALASIASTCQGNITRKFDSISDRPMNEGVPYPKVLPETSWPKTNYPDIVCLAGTKRVKERHSESQKCETHASKSNIIKSDTSTSTTPATILNTSSHTYKEKTTELTWARSTNYKRRFKEQGDIALQIKKRKESIPICKFCLKPLQGHKKYKKTDYYTVDSEDVWSRTIKRQKVEEFTIEGGPRLLLMEYH